MVKKYEKSPASQTLFSCYIEKFSELSYATKKPSGQGRPAAVRNDAAEATRRRRRIPLAGFFLMY
ncbi:hypothetical protein DXA13_02930 [Clostridium sp. AM58-1XD]|nr:hypothetical protein DXA13_02930 [Clostridium sp. AM58-1XD]